MQGCLIRKSVEFFLELVCQVIVEVRVIDLGHHQFADPLDEDGPTLGRGGFFIDSFERCDFGSLVGEGDDKIVFP